ncbi:MAG: hypothetical protein JWN70_1653 [Planctomycetaceae bacterium]|nr:hypothetical protein [Planctomycetaceae bacterium]
MASQWFLKTSGGDEAGPISFQGLADLVRSGEVIEGDLVRPDWNAEWQRADRVVGLFYMARNSLTAVEPDDPPVAMIPDETATVETPPEGTVEPPGWMRRILYLIHSPGARPAKSEAAAGTIGPPLMQSSVATDAPETAAGLAPQVESESTFDPALAGTSSAEWSKAMDAALAHTEARTSGTNATRKTGLLRRLFGWVENRQFRIAFRVVVAIVCATLVVREVDRRSIRETLIADRVNFLYEQQVTRRLRGPPSDWQTRRRARDIRAPAEPLRYFPYVGECDKFYYSTLLIGLAVATGVAAYLTVWFFDGYFTWKFYVRSGKFA